jgi:hypothetical protein
MADAICIVQDDPDDWDREARSMGEVYKRAYVTVSPIASSSCDQGFLERTHPSSFTVPFRLNINPDIKGRYRVSAMTRPSENLRLDVAAGFVRREEWDSAWAHRAWTLQENLLSRLSLIFGTRHVGLRYSHNSSTFGISEPFSGGPRPETPSFGTSLGEPHNISWYEDWNERVVCEISKRELAFRTDVLPCISGMAEFAAKAGVDEYVTGFWRGGHTTGLLWASQRSHIVTRDTQEECLRRLESPSPYIAPSWSWAAHRSVAFEIYQTNDPRWRYHNDRQEAQIEAWSETSTANPFGQVSNGRLELCGAVMSISAASGFALGDPSDLDEEHSRGTHHTLYGLKILKQPYRYLASVVLDWRSQSMMQEVEGLSLALISNREVVRFPWGSHFLGSLTSSKRERHMSAACVPKERVAFGLVLHESTKHPGKYYRVGAFVADPLLGGGLSIFEGIAVQSIEIM